jgi:hypothetical protein
MITKEQLDQILHFVSKHWVDLSRSTDHNAFKDLPTNFWMNSVGGKTGSGRWITMLMYTDDETEAETLKEVLLRWQTKGQKKSSDLIQIKKGQTINN